MMSLPSVPSGDTNSYSGYGPRAWLTKTQQEHSENFIGSDQMRVTADAIRDREVLGSDGMVRNRPALSLSYSQALDLLGMNQNDRLLP